jgi:hypothetical protein
MMAAARPEHYHWAEFRRWGPCGTAGQLEGTLEGTTVPAPSSDLLNNNGYTQPGRPSASGGCLQAGSLREAGLLLLHAKHDCWRYVFHQHCRLTSTSTLMRMRMQGATTHIHHTYTPATGHMPACGEGTVTCSAPNTHAHAWW